MKNFTILSLTGALVLSATPAFAAAPAAPITPNGSQQCKALRTTMTSPTFNEAFGTNKNDKNAFGKCVAQRNAKTDAAVKAAKTNAAKACRTEQGTSAETKAAFATKYGTGKNGKNAFGKCVSTTAKAKANATVKAQNKDTVNAAKTCKTERGASDASKAAFAVKYDNFGKCVSAEAKKAAAARAAARA